MKRSDVGLIKPLEKIEFLILGVFYKTTKPSITMVEISDNKEKSVNEEEEEEEAKDDEELPG